APRAERMLNPRSESVQEDDVRDDMPKIRMEKDAGEQRHERLPRAAAKGGDDIFGPGGEVGEYERLSNKAPAAIPNIDDGEQDEYGDGDPGKWPAAPLVANRNHALKG